MIFYESPHRLKAFFQDAQAVYGNRRAAIANDLTKLFESVYRGSMEECLAYLENADLRGEFTIVISGAPESAG